MQKNKKLKWLTPLLAAVLLAGCGSAAPTESFPPADYTVPNGADSPTLIVKDEQNAATPDFSGAQPSVSNEDLLTMTSEEEVGFALFCPLLSETQFRDMLQRDGVDFIPDRLARQEDRYFAYYCSTGQQLVVCNPALEWFHCINTGDGTAESRLMDAQWLDEDCLLILSGSEAQQLLYTYRVEEQNLQCVYTSPEDKTIVSMTVTEDGAVECTLTDRAAELVQSVLEPPESEPDAQSEPSSNEPVEESPVEELPPEAVRVPIPINYN